MIEVLKGGFQGKAQTRKDGSKYLISREKYTVKPSNIAATCLRPGKYRECK